MVFPFEHVSIVHKRSDEFPFQDILFKEKLIICLFFNGYRNLPENYSLSVEIARLQ